MQWKRMKSYFFATMQMELEFIELTEISNWRKTNIVQKHSCGV